MKQLTIKKKITLWYTGIIAVVLGTILVLVLLFVDKVGISATEEEISAAVTGFSSNINFQDDSFYLDGDTEFYDDGIMFCIYDKNGRLLYGTIPTQFPEETILKSNTPRMITGSNRKWMIYDSVYTYGDDEEMWVRGITSVHSIELFMQTSEKILLIVFPLLIILIGAIGYFMIKRALRQVDLICDEVENISNGKDLSKRLSLPKAKDELYELSEKFNEMFERLEFSFEKERQFTSDVSHELRTPVAVIISQCEYLLENENLSAEDKEEIAVILKQAKRMSKLTNEMLMIARNEQDEQHLMEKLDFGLLKKCIQMETERSGCTRIRFTKPDKDGNVQQYLVKQDPRDIGFKDLSGMGSLAKADELMQQWAYETFDGDDIPMCEFTMLKLPEGYNGFFVHMDHRLIDSCGLVVMIGDLFQLYTYYKYGTAYPQELADFETVLKKDLAKAGNEKRFAKDKKFWDDQLDALGEPLYSDIQGPSVLEEARKRHGNPKLRSSDIEMKDLFVAVKDYYLEPGPTKNLIDFCMNHQLSMTNLLLLGIRTYLSKVNNGQEDITIQNFISRRSTHDEWTSGGSRTIMFPCRTVITPETDFLSAAYEIQNMQNRIYMHSNYDPAFIMDEMRKRYNTPEHTGYESCYLTYQPMTVKVENEMLGTIRQHAKWFANGAATKKMYLTVSHTEDGGMNFSYHYQTAHLEEHDMELLYYYMMRILFKGIAEPDMSIGEIMELV